MSAGVVPLAAPLRRFPLLLVFLGASLLLHARCSPRRPRAAPGLPEAATPPRSWWWWRCRRRCARPSRRLADRAAAACRPQVRRRGAANPLQVEPPPPNDAPPPDPGPPPPVVVGLTLQSTTTASAVAVPVGNTLVGKAGGEARRRRAPSGRATPPLPGGHPARCCWRKSTARRSTRSRRRSRASRDGWCSPSPWRRTAPGLAKVVSGPGHGLNEAALDAILRARFKPATKGGKPVATDLTYGYTFALN